MSSRWTCSVPRLGVHIHSYAGCIEITHDTSLMYNSCVDCKNLITCLKARFNLRRLFSFYAGSNGSHYHVTMTSHNDPRTWCHERKVNFLLKCQTSARTTPRTCAFTTLHDDHHVWTDRNSLTGIDRHWVKRKFSKVFLHKLHLKCIQNV